MMAVAYDPNIFFEACVEAGITARREMDNACYIIGALALEVQTSYGSKWMEEFAKRINMSKRSVQTYRQVVEFYDLTDSRKRLRYLERFNGWPTYTHLLYAMSAKTLDAANDWLERATGGLWTTDELWTKMQEAVGMPLDDVKTGISADLPRPASIWLMDSGKGVAVVIDDVPAEVVAGIRAGRKYVIRYEEIEA